MKIMASTPITSWQIDEENVETVSDFIFLGSKITADGDCSHEIKRCLHLEGTAMTNLKSVLKTRDITLMIKVLIVKAMVFPVVMYGCESWTIRKAESLWRFSREVLSRRDRLPTPVCLGFLGDSDSKESTCNAEVLGSTPGLGRSPGRGHATHSSILAWRIFMDRGYWHRTVHGVTKSQTQLSN